MMSKSEVKRIEVQSGKKICYYDHYAMQPTVGQPAFLAGVEGHPHLKGDMVQTSDVLRLGECGLIETRNTRYMPKQPLQDSDDS